MKIEIEIPEDIYDGIKNNNLKQGSYITLLNAVLHGKVRVQGSGRTKKEEMTTDEAIDLLDNLIGMVTDNHESDYDTALTMAINALEQEQEPLTDKEQRIFLAAMRREEKICREVDEKYPDREPYEDTLVSVCKSIKRKVKKALWE